MYKAEKESEINQVLTEENADLVAKIDNLTLEHQDLSKTINDLAEGIEAKKVQIDNANEKLTIMNETKERVLTDIANQTAAATEKVFELQFMQSFEGQHILELIAKFRPFSCVLILNRPVLVKKGLF